jgi:hypothetical protein
VAAFSITCEEQRGQRLILRSGRHPAIDGQVGEECFDLRGAHGVRVPDAVVADEAFDPEHVGLLGAIGEVPDTGRLPNAVEEFHGKCSGSGFAGKKRVR